MSLSTLPVLADWNNDEDIMSLLSELNIMVGDDDGNLRLDDNVSRAEFAKIAVASSSYKDTVATGYKERKCRARRGTYKTSGCKTYLQYT